MEKGGDRHPVQTTFKKNDIYMNFWHILVRLDTKMIMKIDIFKIIIKNWVVTKTKTSELAVRFTQAKINTKK